MQRKILVLLSFFFMMGSSVLFGQETSLSSTTTATNLLNLDSGDWSFYVDEENQTYYIDFETISVNLSDIVVKDDAGEVLLKENVLDLPVNTIYEIDFSPYGKGHYSIELRSFKGFIEKDVLIK